MEDRALADRLLNYADALAAVCFVGASGLSLALADPEVRCSLVRGGSTEVLAGNLGFAVVVSVLLVMLRRWETDLRRGAPPSDKAARYALRLHGARLGVVWLSTFVAITTLLAASRDPACLAGIAALG